MPDEQIDEEKEWDEEDVDVAKEEADAEALEDEEENTEIL